MKVRVSLCLLGLALSNSSCSKVEENNVAPTNMNTVQTAENQSATPVSNRSAEIVASKSPSNPRDPVVFDGKNYVKKSGWSVPPHNDTYVDATYAEGAVKGTTKAGKAVKVSTIHYIYNIPWIYSETFSFDGSGLDYLKGKIESKYFTELRANGKIFMYTIPGRKVTGLPANIEPHEDPFVYQIQDRDGDSIFETLLSGGQDIIVPNWVFK